MSSDSHNIERHPLSAAFGDMPAEDFADLVADIQGNGQISDIVKSGDGRILDGWHRYRACIEAGIKPRVEPFSYIIEAAVEGAGRTMTEAEFVVAQNAHRRHLTAEQRRRIVGELLKADPAKSDRAIGSMAKVDHKTVAAARRRAEGSGDIPQLSKTIGRDGVTRSKPARVESVVAELPEQSVAPANIAKPRAKGWVNLRTAKVRDRIASALFASAKASRIAAKLVGSNAANHALLDRTRAKLKAALAALDDLQVDGDVVEGGASRG